jgi:hypothetical protein
MNDKRDLQGDNGLHAHAIKKTCKLFNFRFTRLFRRYCFRMLSA